MFPARLESLHAVHLNDAKFEYARCSLHSEKSATCLSFVNGSARVKLVQLETARGLLGLPRWRNGREPACQCRRHKTDAKKKKKRQMQFQSPDWEDPLEEGMATNSSILAWRIPWSGSLVGYSPQGCEESDLIEANENVCTHEEASLASDGSLWTCFCGSFEPLDPPSHRGQLGSHGIGTLTWVHALHAHPD